MFQSSDIDIMAAKGSSGNEVALNNSLLNASAEPFACDGQTRSSEVVWFTTLKVPRGPEGFCSRVSSNSNSDWSECL